MAAAALVHPGRLDKPSLMLTGQPEEEVSEERHLRFAVDEAKYALASKDVHSIATIRLRPLQRDLSTTSCLFLVQTESTQHFQGVGMFFGCNKA